MKGNKRQMKHRIMALLLAASMIAGQTGYTAYAGETAVTEGETVETQAPQTETQAPQTEAPAPQTETQAPQTEAPAPQTEAPAPQTEAPAPQTEAPAPQTEAPAPQTEAPAPQTEAPAPQTEAPAPQTETPDTQVPPTESETKKEEPTEKETESEVETETETEETKVKFKEQTDFGRVIVKLSEEDALPEAAKLIVERMDQAAAEEALRAVTDQGHRRLAGLDAFSIRLECEGETIIPEGEVRIRVEYDKASALGLLEHMEAEDAVFSMEGTPERLGSAQIEADAAGAVSMFRIVGKWTGKFALAGIQNRVNDGEEADTVLDVIAAMPLDYAAVTESWDGSEKCPELVLSLTARRKAEEKQKKEAGEKPADAGEETAADKGQDAQGTEQDKSKAAEEKNEKIPGAARIEKKLGEAADASARLANAVSSAGAKVVNLYADADGRIDDGPLKAVMSRDAVDVSGCLVVINIVAHSPRQALKLPVWPVTDRGASGSAEDAKRIMAGRVIYNVVAQGEDGETSAYSGEVSLKKEGLGIYLIPKGSLAPGSGLTGAAYVKRLTAGGHFTKALLKNDPAAERKALEAEKDKEKEEGTEGGEALTEGMTGESSEALTEGMTEEGGEAQTERESFLAGLDEDALIRANRARRAPAEPPAPGTWDLGVSLSGSTGPEYLPGAALKVSYVPESGDPEEELFDLTSTETGRIALTAEQLEKLAARLPENEDSVVLDLKVTETVPPEGFAYLLKADGTEDTVRETFVTVEMAEGGNTYTFEAVNFENTKKQALNLKIGAVDEKGQALLGGTFTVRAGDAVLEAADGSKLEGLEAGEHLLVLEKYRDKNEKVKEYLDAIAAMQPGGTLPALELTVEETAAPVGYQLPEAEEKTAKVAVEPDTGNTAQFPEKQALIRHTVRTGLLLRISAKEKGKEALLAGAVFSILDQDGKDLKLTGAVQTDKSVLFAVTPSALAQFQNLTDTAPIKIRIKETKAPAGYMLQKEEQERFIQLKDGVLSWKDKAADEREEVTFEHAVRQIELTLKAVDMTGAKDGEPGTGIAATFQLKDKDGHWLEKGGKILTVKAPSSGVSVKLSAADYPKLKQDLEGDRLELTAVQVRTKDSRYTISGSAEQKATIQAADYDAVTGIAKKTVIFKNKIDRSRDSLQIIKRWYAGENTRLSLDKRDTAEIIYMALFYDQALTRRGTGVYSIRISRSEKTKVSSSVILKEIPVGTWYVSETDVNGKPIQIGSAPAVEHYVTYERGEGESQNRITAAAPGPKGTGKTHTLLMKNHYQDLKEDSQYAAAIKIRKELRNEKGEIDSSFSGTVSVRIVYRDNAGKKYLSQTSKVAVKKGVGSVTLYIPMGTKEGSKKKVYIYEMDGAGPVRSGQIGIDGKKYTVAIDPKSVTVSASQKSVPQVTITNTQTAKEPQTESETKKDEKLVADLKLTKKVTYKQAPIRVNSVYYIGIFDDAGLKKLRFKKALVFKNASEVTASLKINLYKLKSKEVTFYFAEVDKDGKLIESGKQSGYSITQNKTSITLNKGNLGDELVVTNDIVKGSKKEEQFNDPSSGFSGGSGGSGSGSISGSEDAQKAGNAPESTKTGDDTPVGRYLLYLALSLSAASIVLLKKRRRA